MHQKLTHIVVGVDGSTNARIALDWACSVAETHQAQVEAIRAHANPISPLVPALGAGSVSIDQLVEPARDQLHTTVASVDTSLAVTETVVMRSSQFALEQASERADLIVLGRTGRSNLENLLVGSTAGYCAHNCRCPVAIIGRTPPSGSVLVGVDGSDRSVLALRWALHVWPVAQVCAVYSHDESLLDELAFDDAHRLQLEADAQAVLAETIASACAQIPVTPSVVRSEVRAGDPRTTVVQALLPDEVLVVGTQGHSGLARWLLGSLADYAVHNAAGSVIVHR